MRTYLHLFAMIAAIGLSSEARAWFFFIPIPNLSKPPALSKVIDALEASTEIRALAYVSEDKTFGAKQWVWGYKSGTSSQDEADRIALDGCNAELQKAKTQLAGGQPLYDFGKKQCELHKFARSTAPIASPSMNISSPEATTQKDAGAMPQQLAASTSTPNSEPSPSNNSDAVKAPKTVENKPAEIDSKSQQASAETTIDFNAEAKKAARILGCTSSDVRVTGTNGVNIEYLVVCSDSTALTLTCDPSGLCLRRNPK